MRRLVPCLFLLSGTLLCWSSLTVVRAQPAAPGVAFTVRETAGIRRTEFPVSTRLSLPRAAASEVSYLRLRTGETDVTAQLTPVSTWEDRSVREVDVDFNASLGAGEQRDYRLEAGSAPVAAAAPRGGLTLTEEADGFQVGPVRLGRKAWPLLASVAYRGEIIGNGADRDNGLSLVDGSGQAHRFGADATVAGEVIKRGPLLVVVRYRGTVRIDGQPVPVVLTCELPNSKSWLKTTVSVEDGSRRVRGLRLDTPFALGAFPWTWDFGTDTGTYGVIRTDKDRVVLSQQVTASGGRWTAETGSGSELRIYEQSGPGRADRVSGWGHLLDGKNAIAFAAVGFAREAGTSRWTLDGQGGARLELAPAGSLPREIVLYQHFVGTPVPIGAATPPAAMIAPLSVSLIR